MKFKRKRGLEVPPKILYFINGVIDVPLEKVEEPLKEFFWAYDKGDFHHWVDLFSHFDSFFEKHIKPRKDLKLEDDFLNVDPPFLRNAVLQILRVTRIILENCSNKHFYSTYEQHLSSLLASTDTDVLEASLQTLIAFLKKTAGKCSLRDNSLTSKLFTLSQGWGNKEGGLGLVACSLDNGCDPVAVKIGSTLHFEFYDVGGSSLVESDSRLVKQGLQVIHVASVNLLEEDDLGILHKLVKDHDVPTSLRFSLLTRLRFARAFDSLSVRRQYICVRLYAFIILVQASNDADDLAFFFSNEPEFVSELVSLVSYEGAVPEEIRILGILSLSALCQIRLHQSSVLSAVTSGSHRGILPSLMQKSVDSITNGSLNLSIVFAEALMALISALVSSTSGSLALREVGFIPTILPLLRHKNPKHLHLVSAAVHVMEGFLDFNNNSAAISFRDFGGLDDTIARLKAELSHLEKGLVKNEGIQYINKGKEVLGSSAMLDLQPVCSEVLVSYHRKLLIKALLRTISLATYVHGSSSRIYGSEETILPHCLSLIFGRAKDFGGGIFSLAANVMVELIHNDPACFAVLDAAGVPLAFIDAIMSGVLCSSEAVECIAPCLDALCLNSTGLQLVKNRNALMCFVKIFTSQTYLRALSGNTPSSVSSGLDELLRHASLLRASGVDMLIELVNTILVMGSKSEVSSAVDFCCSSVHLTEIDIEGKSISNNLMLKMESSIHVADVPSNNTQLSFELFLSECINNAARLLEAILKNPDMCRLFVEKGGIVSVLKLFFLNDLPSSVSIGQSICVAFKSFSHQHSAALARSLCSFLRDHLKVCSELLASVHGAKLSQIESAKKTKLLKSFASLEGLLSLSNHLLKGTVTMLSELGSTDADILKDLGGVYKEIVWQISLLSDMNIVENKVSTQEFGNRDASVSSFLGNEMENDVNTVPIARYTNPLFTRHASSSHGRDQDFVSVVHSAERLHRHSRHGLSRARASRINRQLDPYLDSESSLTMLDSSLLKDKRKNPDVLCLELLVKLCFAMRSFFAVLLKGLRARRRADPGPPALASKSLMTALAKIFYDALSYSGHSTCGLEMSLAVKCQYLGKIVADMAVLTFDSRKHVCNALLVNRFFANGTFRELLTTFEATSQLLWTVPFSFPASSTGLEKAADDNRLCHSPWLLNTLQFYCCLLEYLVNSSVLLPSSSPQAQMLVQPASTGLSIGLFSIPKEPEMFIHLLQSQVLDIILPVWNHPNFPTCNSALISSVVSIITRVYAGVGDVKSCHTNFNETAEPRLSGPPELDETAISSIVEMGFSRGRAEEAFRSVGSNNVEMATDWLVSHPEEIVHEDVQLAQALVLSLGSSSETLKDEAVDKMKVETFEERGVELPPVDDILSACMKLLLHNDSVIFSLTDLLVTLCNRNKGEDRAKVTLYFIRQLKICPADFSKGACVLCSISHLLALLLAEDGNTREVAAENGAVSAVLDILSNFSLTNESKSELSTMRCISALLLILVSMLQPKPKVYMKHAEESSRSLVSSGDISLRLQASTEKSSGGMTKESGDVFENILGKATGHLTDEESQKALTIACGLIKQHVPALAMQAALQLCARLTKSHAIATKFLESGGLSALFNLPQSSIFPGFESVVSSIIRHLLEDPQTLQTAMELEIRQALIGLTGRHSGHSSLRSFLTSMAPVISRDPASFMRAAAAVCQLETSGGRMNIVLLKEKEWDKEKMKSSSLENGASPCEPIQLTENKPSYILGKCSRNHKKVPANLTYVIDCLLEILLSYPSREDIEGSFGSSTPMVVDEPLSKEKGKSKIDEMKKDKGFCSERSVLVSKVTFILKLISDILLMYVHAVGVVLRRDAETSQLRGSGQVAGSGQGGLVVSHILHHLLTLTVDGTTENLVEQKSKLSEKASSFLVILCGRSTEGRRRVIFEIVKSFSLFSSSCNSSSKGVLLPDEKVLAFSDLVNSILSKNYSNKLPGPGCTSDVAKAMLDGGMLQSLSNILRVLDLDHPNAPKVVNLILKAMESLTRAANFSDQLLKLDDLTKRSRRTPGRAEDPSRTLDGSSSDAAQTENQQVHESRRNEMDSNSNVVQSMELESRDQNASSNTITENGVEFVHEMDRGVFPNSSDIGIEFRVESRTDDMGDDDEEMVEDDEDEDIDVEDDHEGTAILSLEDTDVDDRDDHALGEYNDDMIDGEYDDFPENHVIEVRWREGLGGLDNFRVLRTSGDAANFADVAAETFPGVHVQDMFHLRHPSVDRRRQSENRTSLDRSGLDGSNFQHPLLLRPSQSGEPMSSTLLPSNASTRDIEASSFGGFDVAPRYMFDNSLSAHHTSSSFLGDHLVGEAPPSLIDFSLVTDSLHAGGRRGQGYNRWTDDGQPQAGSHAAAIAQAIEEPFVAQLRSGNVGISLTQAASHNSAELDQPSRQPSSNVDVQVPGANTFSQPSQNEHELPESHSEHQEGNLDFQGDLCFNVASNGTTKEHNAAVVNNQVAPESVEEFSDDLNAPNDIIEDINGAEGYATMDTMPDSSRQSTDIHGRDIQMQDYNEVPARLNEPSYVEGHCSFHLDPESIMGDLSVDHTELGHVYVDLGSDMTNTVRIQVESPEELLHVNEEPSPCQVVAVPSETSGTVQPNMNNEASSTNAIDPTFLEALPEDLRAEVLASQQASRQTQPPHTATPVPSIAEEIDPEFLAALPPDIQVEVLSQQRAQRLAQVHQAQGQPVEMDSASIIATFPPELREEVLLTSSEAVLSALPSALIAEAQMLRDRASSHYHARSNIFGGSHRLGSRHLAVDRQTVIDRGVAVSIGRRAFPTISNFPRAKNIDGAAILDTNALKPLVRLLRLAQPLSKGLLQRLFLNLCANGATRAMLVSLLVAMVRLEAESSCLLVTKTSQRLYGCQWNIVYSRPQPLSGLPPLVLRRVLEVLTYLATNHSSVADILFYFDQALAPEPSAVNDSKTLSENDKEKLMVPVVPASGMETSSNVDIPLILLLKLLKMPIFLRSNPHLEQVMDLIQVVVTGAVAKIDCLPHNAHACITAESRSLSDTHNTQQDSSSSDLNANSEKDKGFIADISSMRGKEGLTTFDILLRIPETDLRNLCGILAQEGLSDRVYSIAADVVNRLAFNAAIHRKFFASELAGLARNLSSSSVSELVMMRSTCMLGLSVGLMAGTSILRVLQALCMLEYLDDESKEEIDKQEDCSILFNLNIALEPLWQELSDCISATEAKLEKSSAFSFPTVVSDSENFVGSDVSLSSPLPLGAQRLLPYIEAFFVICEKLQMNNGTIMTDNISTAREVKDVFRNSPSPSIRNGTGTMTFLKITEKHRRLLNVFIRQNHKLLENSLSMMLKVPKLIDFDNKRAYFRSRIRQQHEQHHSASLRISVRRAYVLEDSYNQLRMRSSQDLKGRLTVQFQGEEGIDAGGLTREWYQLLSRVIFDKGALLFTTVGNDATFQPNPNSVYQTEHLSYFKFVGRLVAKAIFDGQLLDVYFTRSFYKHILGVKVTYHDIEAVDPDYYKNLKWMLENDVSDIPDLTFSMDADEEKHILYEKTEVTDSELIPGGRNIRVTEETKYEYVDLVAGHILTTAIRPQINSFLEGFNELVPRDLIAIFNDKELELLISGLPEIDMDDLKSNTEYTGYTAASSVIQWFWEVVNTLNKEDMARFLQFVTGTSKVPLEGFQALQGISGPQRFQIHKAYGAPKRLPSAHTCFNQLDLPEYASKELLEERLLLAIHEASEGFGFG